MKPEIVGHTRQWLAAAAVSVALCAVLIGVILGHDGWAAAVSSSGAVPQDSIAILGNTLVDAQGLALPFEVASVLLLVALIGAATIVRER
jgi:NADH:ubiquinone oxidoreductase subunit 6 (subunit J)